jgi:hypothetical protein
MYAAHPVPRGRLLNMRVNDEEWERLNLLAQHYGVNVSAVIRMLAKRDAVACWSPPRSARGGRRAAMKRPPRR